MNLIAIGNFNNYYNRIHKPAMSLCGQYVNSASGANWHLFSKVNFNRNDGVTAEQVINLGSASSVFVSDYEPDYLIVCKDAEGSAQEFSEVYSRWFVLESHWNRERQLILTLRRDLVADFWNDFKDEDFYCEKGPIPSGYDVLKYNNEGMTFNQILTKRIPLKQSSGQTGRYIVGYIDRGWNGGTVYSSTIYKEFDSFEELPFRKLNNLPFADITNIEYGFEVSMIKEAEPTFTDPIMTSEGPFVSSNNQFTLHANLSNGSGGTRGGVQAGSSQIGSPSVNTSDLSTLGASLATALAASDFNLIPSIESDVRSTFQIVEDAMSIFDGKLIKVGSKVYLVTYNVSSTYKWVPVGRVDGSLGKAVWDVLKRLQSDVWTTGNPLSCMQKVARFKTATFSLTEQSGTSIPASRTHPGNLPYDIFYLDDNEYTRAFASNLASQYIGGNVVYDIQVLPFKPDGISSGINVGNNNILYWANSDSKHGHLYHDAVKSYTGDGAYKKGSNLDMCRIVSPDGASAWEFNPAKIGGVAKDSILYEVTFAPFRPYIHIYPYFNDLYGTVRKTSWSPNEGESRGLICTGDYSIPYSTNNWATYQLQNSAYQLAHDRMIQNMSVNQSAERAQELVNAVAGSFQSSAQGFQAGMMGGPVGAGIGAVVGGVAGLGGGLSTYVMNQRLRAEEMSYAEDMFGYQLQNIKAQAQPLAHSNYLTVGVAYFPYVELYEAKTYEEYIFSDRLRVNGWSLGIVTTLTAMKTAATGSYTPDTHEIRTRFVKGRLVKFSGNEDAHVANEINIELQRGVRFLAS